MLLPNSKYTRHQAGAKRRNHLTDNEDDMTSLQVGMDLSDFQLNIDSDLRLEAWEE